MRLVTMPILAVLIMCSSVLGSPDRCNLILIPQDDLYNLSDILIEQRYSHDSGIDLLGWAQSMGHHSQKLHSPSEYLNDSELDCVVESSAISIQSYQDMINESNSLFVRGEYNESLRVYENFTKLEAMLVDVWACRCAAMKMLFNEMSDTITYSEAEVGYVKCMECDDYWKKAKDGETSWAVRHLRENMTVAKAELDRINEESAYQAAFNASGINVTNGDYDTFKVTAPMGPFDMSFQIRISGEMSVRNYTTQQAIGSGKSYHYDNYTVFEYSMPTNLVISIAKYNGSTRYQASSPLDDYETAESNGKYSVYWDEPIEIDGVTGREIAAYYVKNPDKRDRYIISYCPEKNVFVQIRSNLDFDSNIKLLIETMEITRVRGRR